MIAYTKSKILRLLKIDFVRFSIVGGSGFVINLILLVVLTKFFNTPVLIAQFIGAEIALFSNFILHHHWTYKKNKVKKTILKLILQFHATSWPAIIGSSLMVSGGVEFFHLNKVIALIISSIIVLLWNFFWTRYVIWKDTTQDQIEAIIK